MIARFARTVAAMTVRQRRCPSRREVPSLWWLTDCDRMTRDDVIAAAAQLPAGSTVVIRHRNGAARREWVNAVGAICRRRRLKLLVADDVDTAIACRCDGFHAPEKRAGAGLTCRLRLWLRGRQRLLSASAHTDRAVRRARFADAIMIAPVLPTASHPDRRSLGAIGCARLVRHARGRAIALGGIDATTVRRLNGICLLGIAGSGFAVLEHGTN